MELLPPRRYAIEYLARPRRGQGELWLRYPEKPFRSERRATSFCRFAMGFSRELRVVDLELLRQRRGQKAEQQAVVQARGPGAARASASPELTPLTEPSQTTVTASADELSLRN